MKPSSYLPSDEILQKYADIFVHYGANLGQGVNKGDVVWLRMWEGAWEFIPYITRSIVKAGCKVQFSMESEYFLKELYLHGDKEQASYFGMDSYLERVREVDHMIAIAADLDKEIFKDADSAKMAARRAAGKPIMDLRSELEANGEFSWTLGEFPTDESAKAVGMSLKEYWEVFIQACFLNEDDPAKKIKYYASKQQEITTWLNDLEIEYVRVVAEGIDLKVKIGPDRKWISGGGHNVPSFEIFTSPNWREAQGKIYFNEPLYRFGNKIEGIWLEFKDGIVVNHGANSNQHVIADLLKIPNADKIGEFSLTDKRLSQIDKIMGNTLFDENYGGEFGNTHIALGNSYHDCYKGELEELSDKKVAEKLGFNNSAAHTDIISTSKREVFATLADGSEILIYKDGEFQCEI